MQLYKNLIEINNLWDLLKLSRDRSDATLEDLKETDNG